MLFADAPATASVPAPSPTFSTRVTAAAGRAKDYASKAERIINAPVYDAAAVLGVDVIWLGGVLFALKIVITGLVMEFRKPEAVCAICPVPEPLPER